MIIDTTYKPSYPCKVISSFYDNFFHIHIYELIKKITLRKEQINSRLKKKIQLYFCLFNLIFSLQIENFDFVYIKNFYEFLFKKKLSSKLYNFIITYSSIDFYSFIYLCVNIYDKFTFDESFLLFLIMTLRLNIEFKYSCIFPNDLIFQVKSIDNVVTRRYFLKSYINNLYSKKVNNLKIELISYIKSNIKIYSKMKISNIFLFGSVLNDDYYESSDIDLVIKYKKGITFDEIISINKYIKNDLFNKFQRQSDIHEYNEFITNHSIDLTLCIF